MIKVSIIVPVYNTKPFLKRCFRSLAYQNLTDIEIIIVDDGSTDGGAATMDAFAGKYGNATLIRQTNKGRGAARNAGIRVARGKYLAFVDSDDWLPRGSLALRYRIAERDGVDISIGRCRQVTGWQRKAYPAHRNIYPRFVYGATLAEYPNVIRDSFVSNKLFRAEFLYRNEILFPEGLSKEDFIFMQTVLCAGACFSVVPCEIYNYRVRPDIGEISGTQRLDLPFLRSIFHASETGDRLIQQAGLPTNIKQAKDRDVMRMFKNRIPRKMQSGMAPRDTAEFIDMMAIGLANVYADALLTLPAREVLFCLLTKQGAHKASRQLYVEDAFKSEAAANAINQLDNADLQTYVLPSLHRLLRASKKSTDRALASRSWSLIARISRSADNAAQLWSATKSSLEQLLQSWSEHDPEPLDEAAARSLAERLSTAIGNTQAVYDALPTLSGWSLFRAARKAGQLLFAGRQNAAFARAFIKSRLAVAYQRALPSRLEGAWLFGERLGQHAGDNGYILYCHFRKHQPDAKAFFVLRRSSPVWDKVATDPGVVRYNSIRHLAIFYAAHGYVFTDKPIDLNDNIYALRRLATSAQIHQKKYVMLHHGAMYLKLTSFRTYDRHNFDVPIDMFVANSDYEKQLLIDHAHHHPDTVKITGFPRFDIVAKHKDSHKYLLFMPTWRREMRTWSRAQFQATSYYRRIQSLLNNTRLLVLLKQADIRLKFHVHFNMLQWLGLFASDSDRIDIQCASGVDVTDLLCNCSLLITDYSTISFDVAYMEKPVIFYNLGKEGEGSRGQGPISDNYREELFGRCIDTAPDLLHALEYYVDHSYQVEDLYLDRAKRFFKYTDAGNTERTYNELCALVESGAAAVHNRRNMPQTSLRAPCRDRGIDR